MAKKKSITAAAVGVPKDRGAADALLGDIGQLKRELEKIDLDLTEVVANARAAASERAKPLAAELKAKVAALAAYAEAHRAELLPPGRRSVSLSQGVIGFRYSSPKVDVVRGQEESVIATLERLDLIDFIRIEKTLNREAILAAPERIEGLAGICVVQTESFYVKPLDVSSEEAVTTRKVTDARQLQAADAAQAA